MDERLYTNLVATDEMQQIVAACHFTQDALFLAENLPMYTIIEQKRQELLRFTYLREGLSCAEYTSGRIFQEDRELRWEKQKDKVRVIYLGLAEDSMFGGKLNESEVLSTLKKEAELTYYYLFGERLKKGEDLDRLSKVAKEGDFAVIRIPRILRYPVSNDGKKYARLAVREYRDATTNQVMLFRFQSVEAVE